MVDYKMSSHWYLRFDAGFNYLFTSRIDGAATYYYNSNYGGSGQVLYYDPNEVNPDYSYKPGAPGVTEAIATPNDYFFTVKLGIKYRLSYKKRDVNTGTAAPSKRDKWHKLPSNQFFDNLVIPGTDTPKVIR